MCANSLQTSVLQAFDSQDGMVSCFGSDVYVRVLKLLKPGSLNSNPTFGSHASYHISCDHHGAEADDDDVDVGDPYHSCSSIAVER